MVETFVWMFVAYLVYFYIREYLEKRKSPPGPLPIPILGNMIQLAMASEIPSLAFTKFSKTYGEIFQLRMGMKTMVVLGSLEAINTIFTKSETLGRDQTGSWYDRNLKKNLGIIFGDGVHWEKTKTWTIRSLRDYGFGKSSTMESSIREEIRILFESIDKTRSKNNNVIQVSGIFVLPVFKIMLHMITGRSSTPEEKEVITDLLLKSEEMIRKGIFGAGLVTAYPFVRYIIPEMTGHKAQMDFYHVAHKAARDMLTKSGQVVAKNESSPENLIEAFAIKMKEEEGNPDTIFTEDNFTVIYMDLLQAGSDTNSAFLEAFLLFMVLYPDVQAKVYEEINRFIETNQKEVTFADRKQMIYTQACIYEVHRHTKVVQTLVPRRVLQDFYYKNYLIKKDYILLANLHSVYFSEDVWEDPFAFRPEKFIGENGELVKLNCLMPFGLGKRACPGELLSHVSVFLYTTTILRRYKLSIVPGKPVPEQKMHEGLTSKPFPFEITVSDRN